MGSEGLREKLSRLVLFEGMGDDALAAIEAELEWFCLPGGLTLFREGDRAEALYVVISGGLDVMVVGSDGRQMHAARLLAGETVGEMALISGAPRSATVVAVRDTELLRFTKSNFEQLIERHPQAMLHLTGLLVNRLQRATRRAPPTREPKTLALIPLGPDVPSAALAGGLAEMITESGQRVRVVDAVYTDRTTEWFNEMEAAHDFIVYLGESEASPWTQLCLRQADRILLVAPAGTAPGAPAELETVLDKAPRGRSELIILQHDNISQPSGGAAWLERYPVDFHCHVRPSSRADLARVARLATGRAVGLVLSGGGARGFAHLGVIRALQEAGVPIDLVGGSSMGAIVAAGVALEWDMAELEDRLRRAFVESNPFSDYTLPFIALVKGRKVSQRLREHFGDTRVEDLWRPYFCLSSNLTTGRAMVHRNGPLWRALRASIAIPGVLPPAVEAGEVLVDGGVINNFPVDVMSAMWRGPVIGVDVASDRALTAAAEDLEQGSFWWLLRQGRRNAPGIVSLLIRAGTVRSEGQMEASRDMADLLLEPPLEMIGVRDWHAYERAIEAGYRYAMETLERLDGSFLGD